MASPDLHVIHQQLLHSALHQEAVADPFPIRHIPIRPPVMCYRMHGSCRWSSLRLGSQRNAISVEINTAGQQLYGTSVIPVLKQALLCSIAVSR